MGFSPRYKNDIKAETPSATVIGAPIISKMINNPKRIVTIVVSMAINRLPFILATFFLDDFT
jgi:hypothetical protein